MPVAVKICGLTDAAALDAAVEGGAGYLGFVFYPPSPRALDVEQAAALARRAPPDRIRVGVFVDPDDDLLDRTLARLPLEALQLHGGESPERVRAIRTRTGRVVIKALKVADAGDLAPVPAYAAVADMLLFDARPPKEPGRFPGGNGLAFDWRLIAGLDPGKPVMLSGGLDPGNVAAAIALTQVGAVDVSSGVERRPGEKDPDKIEAFVKAARAAFTASDPGLVRDSH